MNKNIIKDNILRELFYHRQLGGCSIVPDLSSIADEAGAICEELHNEQLVYISNGVACLTEYGESFCLQTSFTFPSMPIVQLHV